MISVVASTYQRGVYLDRALHGYATQELREPSEYVLIDDGSTDDTREIVARWSKHLNIVYIKITKPEGLWRDCSRTLNAGIRYASGQMIIPTHPEVIPGRTSLQDLWDHRSEKMYLSCKVYYLTPSDQEMLASERIPWRTEGNLAVRQIPNFYSQHSPEVCGNPDYTPQRMDEHTSWPSWVFGGYTKETWRWFGGFSEFDHWGSMDVDQFNRRLLLGIPIYTAMDEQTICIHQNHDQSDLATHVPSPRIMEKAMAHLPRYRTPEEARLGHI